VKNRWPAILILAAYLLVGTFYAVYTPRWQVPDEPAHYNYIRALAAGEGFPVLEPGDYDQQYLEQLKSEHFPPQLPITEVEYEDHQPPLYYLLATPIYLLSNGATLPLRLFSLLLGAGALIALMAIGHEVFPRRTELAWLAAGIVAFIPQHIAMMAGINNDALTEALTFFWIYLALRYLRGLVHPAALGALLGAILLTKTTAYSVALLGILVIALRWNREGRSWRWALMQAVQMYTPATLLGMLWWGRDLSVYGWPDLFGLGRHNDVVVGQPRTADWIAQYGWGAYLQHFFQTTFQSFWGQFGWMGVILNEQVYLSLALFTSLMIWGAVWQFVEALQHGLPPRQKSALIVLGVLGGITCTVIYLGYNFTFVQHQGRYLYPALPALALAGAVGLSRLAERKLAVITWIPFIILAVITLIMGLVQGDIPVKNLMLIVMAPISVTIAAWVPERWRPVMGALVLAALFALDWYCLFGFIVPLLS